MRFKKTVATSLVVVALSLLMVLKAGCGGGFLGLEDYQRDLLGIGGLAASILFGQDAPAAVADVDVGTPIPGADGEPGAAGQAGADGLDCWDTNGNGVADVDTEDVNGDGVVDVGDCLGEDGASGSPGTAGDSTGTDGLDCWDLNGNGVADAASEDVNGDGAVDVLDCRGTDGSDGADGAAGSGGGSGPAGADGADGAVGPTDFTVFIDDFFTLGGSPTGNLPVDVVSIREPALGGTGLNPETSVRIAYRVAIPNTYKAGKPVTMRMFFDVTGTAIGTCMEMTVSTARLRHNSSIEQNFDQRWVRLSPEPSNDGPSTFGLFSGVNTGRTVLVVDLPINVALTNGLGYWMDLAVADFLAFELTTTTFDGRLYHLVGVEFFSRDSAAVVNAEIFGEEPCPCGGDTMSVPGIVDDQVFIWDADTLRVSDIATLTSVANIPGSATTCSGSSDSCGGYDDGRHMVFDNVGQRIFVSNHDSDFDVYNTFLEEQSVSWGISLTEPLGIAPLADGRLLITDEEDSIGLFRINADLSLDLEASGDYSFVGAEGLAHDTVHDRIYVADEDDDDGDIEVFDGTSLEHLGTATVCRSDGLYWMGVDGSSNHLFAIADSRCPNFTDGAYGIHVYNLGCRADDITLNRTLLASGGSGQDCYGALTVSESTDRLFAIDYCASKVDIYDTLSLAFLGSIPIERAGEAPLMITVGHLDREVDPCDVTSPSDADCNDNSLIDACEIADGRAEDCNENGTPDSCDIEMGRERTVSSGTGRTALGGVAVDPFYAGVYTLADLGSVPGVPTSYGGLTLKFDNPNVLLIGGNANNQPASIYSIAVTRDSNNHITGFSGSAAVFADANFNDGGVAYGPDNVLFLSRWPANGIGQTKPGSTVTDKIIDLEPLGVESSPGGLAFVPPGLPGAGQLKIVSWPGGEWYSLDFSPDGSGTFDITSASLRTTIQGGPEGIAYVPPGSPLFDVASVLVSEHSDSTVATYQVDASGDPILATRRNFVTGLEDVEGAFIDPLTGDFLFSTFGGGNRVIVVQGFTASEPLGSLDCNNNSIPDECDIASEFSADCNSNGVPDECEALSSLEGVWRFEFSTDDVCDLFSEFFKEIRYLRFDANDQLVENWIEVENGEACINFPYPSDNQPNLFPYKFFGGQLTSDTSRQILSSEFDPVCGTFDFTELVQVGEPCDGEDGTTGVSGSFLDGNNLAGMWEFQTSEDSVHDGFSCSVQTLERLCGSFSAVRVNGPPDCFIVNGCDDCNDNGICDDIEIISSVVVTTLDSTTGASISSFPVGLVTEQFVPFIEVDASANIWVGRKNTGHGSNEPSPDDKVAKFTSTGTLLQTVKGPMHDPSALAFDSLGNIYVGGSPDGGSLDADQIYKYDSNGVFLMSFGEQTGAALGADFNALEFAPGDRLFATTGNPHRLYEYTTAGVQVRVVSSFDGASRFGRGLALSPDGLSLWNYQPRNGPGEDFIVQYDLNLTILSTFGMNSLGNPSLRGMDTLQNGNLVARSGSKVIEISPTGTLIREIDFSAIDGGDSLRRGFAVDNSGNYLVNHGGLDVADCNSNSILDECDISANPSLDGNSNGIIDSCEDD